MMCRLIIVCFHSYSNLHCLSLSILLYLGCTLGWICGLLLYTWREGCFPIWVTRIYDWSIGHVLKQVNKMYKFILHLLKDGKASIIGAVPRAPKIFTDIRESAIKIFRGPWIFWVGIVRMIQMLWFGSIKHNKNL